MEQCRSPSAVRKCTFQTAAFTSALNAVCVCVCDFTNEEKKLLFPFWFDTALMNGTPQEGGCSNVCLRSPFHTDYTLVSVNTLSTSWPQRTPSFLTMPKPVLFTLAMVAWNQVSEVLPANTLHVPLSNLCQASPLIRPESSRRAQKCRVARMCAWGLARQWPTLEEDGIPWTPGLQLQTHGVLFKSIHIFSSGKLPQKQLVLHI